MIFRGNIFKVLHSMSKLTSLYSRFYLYFIIFGNHNQLQNLSFLPLSLRYPPCHSTRIWLALIFRNLSMYILCLLCSYSDIMLYKNTNKKALISLDLVTPTMSFYHFFLSMTKPHVSVALYFVLLFSCHPLLLFAAIQCVYIGMTAGL